MVCTDAAVLAAACYAAWGLRLVAFDDRLPFSWESWLKEPLVLFVVPIGVYCLSAFGLYRPRRDRTVLNEAFNAFKASFSAVAVTIVALWATGSEFASKNLAESPGSLFGVPLGADAPRFQLAALGLCIFVMVGASRAASRAGLQFLRSRGWNLRHVAIVGSGRLGQITARTLARNSWTGIEVSYFISHHERSDRKRCLDKPVLGDLSRLSEVLAEHPVDAVYIALPSRNSNRLQELLVQLERFAVDVRIVPDVSPRYLPQRMQMSELEGMPILSYRESPLNGTGGVLKRVLDVVGALVAIAIFSPVMIVVGLLVAMSGPGPVIFRQRRVSYGGEVFDLYKFRTMTTAQTEADAARWTSRHDPRITPIGRWLRRTSIDELPQLFNVLRGEMSLVGPRPERPELIGRFREDWRGYMLRQHVKAGMTGWAQVNGLRGDTSLRKRLQYDLFYVRNWSLWLDVRILLLTVIKGFFHPNAH